MAFAYILDDPLPLPRYPDTTLHSSVELGSNMPRIRDSDRLHNVISNWQPLHSMSIQEPLHCTRFLE